MKPTQEQLELFAAHQHLPALILRSRFHDNFYNEADRDETIQEGMIELWQLCIGEHGKTRGENFGGLVNVAITRKYIKVIKARMRMVTTIQLSNLYERRTAGRTEPPFEDRPERIYEAMESLEREELALIEKVFYLQRKIKTIAREVESTGFKVQRQLEKTLARFSLAYGALTGKYDGLIKEPKWRNDLLQGRPLIVERSPAAKMEEATRYSQERLEKVPGATAKLRDVHADYMAWSQADQKMSQGNLTRCLSRTIPYKDTEHRHYIGVRIKK